MFLRVPILTRIPKLNNDMRFFSSFAISHDLWLNFGQNCSSKNNVLIHPNVGTGLAHAVARRSSPYLTCCWWWNMLVDKRSVAKSGLGPSELTEIQDLKKIRLALMEHWLAQPEKILSELKRRGLYIPQEGDSSVVIKIQEYVANKIEELQHSLSTGDLELYRMTLMHEAKASGK
jgi:hypothetical protein